MTTFDHEFETTLGDELSPRDLIGATYKVVETYVDVDDTGTEISFTHRIELHDTDDQLMALIEERWGPDPRTAIEEAIRRQQEDPDQLT